MVTHPDVGQRPADIRSILLRDNQTEFDGAAIRQALFLTCTATGLQSRPTGTCLKIAHRKEHKMKGYMSHIGLAALIGGLVILMTSTSALAMRETLVGAVIKTDTGVALSTPMGEYLPLGRRLNPMEGKTLSVTGDVENGVESNTIHTRWFKVLTDKDTIDPTTSMPGTKTH
jgi:hypothetical protein